MGNLRKLIRRHQFNTNILTENCKCKLLEASSVISSHWSALHYFQTCLMLPTSCSSGKSERNEAGFWTMHSLNPLNINGEYNLKCQGNSENDYFNQHTDRWESFNLVVEVQHRQQPAGHAWSITSPGWRDWPPAQAPPATITLS